MLSAVEHPQTDTLIPVVTSSASDKDNQGQTVTSDSVIVAPVGGPDKETWSSGNEAHVAQTICKKRKLTSGEIRKLALTSVAIRPACEIGMAKLKGMDKVGYWWQELWDFHTATAVIQQNHPEFLNGGLDCPDSGIDVPRILTTPLLVNGGRLIFVYLSSGGGEAAATWFKRSKWLRANKSDREKMGQHVIGFLQDAHLVMSKKAKQSQFMTECASSTRVCLEGHFTPIEPQILSKRTLNSGYDNYFPITLLRPLGSDPRFQNLAAIIKKYQTFIFC